MMDDDRIKANLATVRARMVAALGDEHQLRELYEAEVGRAD